METSAHCGTPASTVYEIGGRRFDIGSNELADAIAEAYAAHQRPLCMCQVEGVEMYVAHLPAASGGYIVKRMPDTGTHHAPQCPSYEPPAEVSGLAQVLGSAITEDPTTGETTLKLDFALTKMPGRSRMPPAGSESDSVATNGTRLSLRALLHYLWDQADLTRWHPGFADRRSWSTVRRLLLQAAQHMRAGGEALCTRLYVPEPFRVEEREAIKGRRMAQWQHAVSAPETQQQLLLLIGEVKEIVPARYGYKAVIRHVPDQAIAVDEKLYRRVQRRFDSELALWGATEEVHMIIVASFGLSSAGVPAIAEMSLMPVTAQWLPIENSFERQLVERLVVDGRAFIKGLRYNLDRDQCVAAATLTDTGATGSLMFVVPPGKPRGFQSIDGSICQGDSPVWIWNPASEAMPRFPCPALSRQAVQA